MVVDNCLLEIDSEFLDDLDEIVEDTMVQLFVIQPRTSEALQSAKEVCASYGELFYAVPLSFGSSDDPNAVAYYLDNVELLSGMETLGKPLYVDAELLNSEVVSHLQRIDCGGAIFGGTEQYTSLPKFYLCIDPDNAEEIDKEILANLSMDEIVLGSCYPKHSIEDIHTSVKTISDAMFRPEQSITARATKNTLVLLGFKKG